MIINIDHIAFSSIDIEKDIEKFTNNNYKLLFCEELPNLHIKKGYLCKYNANHKLALLESSNGYNVEILNHGQINKEDGYIELLQSNKIIIKTNNIHDSKLFWNYFGFNFQNDVQGEFCLPFSKQKTLKLELKHTSKILNNKLDDKGYNCIGIITTSIEKEIKNIKNTQYKISPIELLKVNNKNMRICFIQRELNEIVELIEIIRE